MVHVDCLRAEHKSGAQRFPIFIGFIKPSDVHAIAVAPHFTVTTEDEEIAGNVIGNPVKEWQRPLDQARVDEIQRIFSNRQEIMPNAVLLAAPDPDKIDLSHSGHGDLWTLTVSPGSTPPLWILDGQHRINGLAGAHASDLLPFVLLASHGQSARYQPSMFAKIFAQVTTTAEGLHPLHDEWLKFAFSLGKYDDSAPQSGAANAVHKKAMRTVVDLCHEQYLDVGRTKSNPFWNRVAFNPRVLGRKGSPPPLGPSPGGFQLDAAAFESAIAKSYYGHRNLPAGELPPDALAREIGLAYEALVACHATSTLKDSVLLNSAGTTGAIGHKALQDGFLHGILRLLAKHGQPSDWKAEMDSRAISTTDWSSSSWAADQARTGEIPTNNKRLARAIFEKLFGGRLGDLFVGATPASLDLADYFQGAVGAAIVFQSRRVANATLLPFSSADDDTKTWESGTTKTRFDVTDHAVLRISRTTPNVVSVAITDTDRPREKDWNFKKLKTGLVMTPTMLAKNPVKLNVEITFYGGERRSFDFPLSHA